MRRLRSRNPRYRARNSRGRRNWRRWRWLRRATNWHERRRRQLIMMPNPRPSWRNRRMPTHSWPRQPRKKSTRARRRWNWTRACRRSSKNRRAIPNPINEDAVMNAKSITAMGGALALSACASMPQPNAALENARAAVQTAEADPNVIKYAPLDLERAKKDPSAAEDAALHHRDAEIAQSAYLATQNARIAQAHGAAKADDARVAAGQSERDRIMLAARTREAENAKAAAANSQAIAAVALSQRDQANQDAAQAQRDAAEAQREAAQAQAELE